MGLSVFPAPSTGPSIPEGLRPPKITYSNNWSLTGLTNITNFTNSNGGAVLAYRKTDNCLYFTGKDTSNLWKFDLTTKTGSRVRSFNNNPDLVGAQDGTLYYVDNINVAAPSNYYRSVDGGVTELTQGNSDAGTQGYLTLIDDGYWPGLTGNVIFTTRASGGGAKESAVSVNNASASVKTRYQEETRPAQFSASGIDIVGGICLFPVRDGDDSPTNPERFAITDTTSSTIVNSSVVQQGYTYFRYATLGRHRESGNNYVSISHMVPSHTLNSSNVFQATDGFSGIGRPTSIQNRWIVGVNKAQTMRSANFYIHDYENNFARVGGGPLRIDSTNGTAAVYGQNFSNPIYISATKKLYVFYAFYTSGQGDARMYEYDVTTY